MFSVCNLLSSGQIKRSLLLDGDTVTKRQNANKREEMPLFEDADTATALEYSYETFPMMFYMGTKSEDGFALIQKLGACRNPFMLESLAH